MIYICGTPSNIVGATRDFIARGIENATIGTVGATGIFAIPNEKQVAYDTYAANLEAFLCATGRKEKVLCHAPGYPFPEDYKITVPIRVPSTVAQFRKVPPEAVLRKIQEEAKGMEMEELVTKGGSVWLIRSPTIAFIKKLRPVCAARGINITDASQMSSTFFLLPIYGYIDAFLATNTYSYKRAEYDDREDLVRVMPLEMRIANGWIRNGYGDKIPKACALADIKTAKRRKISNDEVEDLTPQLGCVVSHSVTSVAKPSLTPSSASWGRPNQVPYKRGILFPYFPGMLQPDTAFIRRIVHSRFLRLFGENMESIKENWMSFRDGLGAAATTQAGIELSHILAGVDLAMQSQTQTYLLFDNERYLGFVLLGGEFRVQYRGKWYEPNSEEDLKKELATLYTHEAAVEMLVEALARCKVGGGDMAVIGKDDLSSPEKVLDVLAKVDTEEEDAAVAEVRRLVTKLNFPGRYLTFKPTNITWAMDMLLQDTDTPLEDQLLYIPSKDFDGIGERVFQVLAAFGPRSFSFIDGKGEEVKVPAEKEDKDFFAERDEKEKLKNTRIIVYEKDLRTCVRDWKRLVETGKVQMLFSERAAASRAQVFKGDDLSLIWGALKGHASGKRIGVAKKDAEKKSGEPKKKKQKVDDSRDVDFSAWA